MIVNIYTKDLVINHYFDQLNYQAVLFFELLTILRMIGANRRLNIIIPTNIAQHIFYIILFLPF
jgi:hypothetical protein